MDLVSLFSLGLFEFVVVRQGEVRVIERRGKFARIATPGVTFLMSLWGAGETVGKFKISQVKKDKQGRSQLIARPNVTVIPMRMQVDDYPKESVITRDNATLDIDAVVYYKVMDPEKAVYQVSDYVAALQKLVQSALRDECGKYELDELLTSRDKINTSLRHTLDEATDPWGIKVDRVEIKDIDLGQFGQILAEQRAAETKRRTEITEAEGKKRADILRSEGTKESRVLEAQADKESRILAAEGEKQARILQAEAEAEALLKLRKAEAQGYRLLQQAFSGDAPPEVIELLRLQKAEEVSAHLASGNASKVYLPTDLNSVFGLAVEKLTDSNG